MSFIVRNQITKEYIEPEDGALIKYLQANGSLPKVTLSIFPIENLSQEIFLDRFISYTFRSSILSPVDSFSAELFYSTTLNIKNKHTGKDEVRRPRCGDIFVLRANNIPICSGIVDQLDMETDHRNGTKMTVQGRNLLGQWEDQDSISLDSTIVYASNVTISQVVSKLADNTRIVSSQTEYRFATTRGWLFATQPGESKLSSMQRYCEALDMWFWTKGDGSLIVGRPDMYGIREGVKGQWFCSSGIRKSNVLAIRSTRNETQIPNSIIPIWNGQEKIIAQVPQAALLNNSAGPKRLRSYGHRVPRAVVISTPQGDAPQDLADINTLRVAAQNAAKHKENTAGNSNLIQAYAKREMAKANLKELIVQVNIVGHYNSRAEPINTDQTYHIKYDDDGIDEDMYLYEIEYSMDEASGPQTKLYFCRQTAIVSDVRAL